MFNINDYLITTTSAKGGLDTNPTIDVEITIDKEKIKKDIELFKIILESLEKLIGPYTIKMDSQKTKIKKRKIRKMANIKWMRYLFLHRSVKINVFSETIQKKGA